MTDFLHKKHFFVPTVPRAAFLHHPLESHRMRRIVLPVLLSVYSGSVPLLSALRFPSDAWYIGCTAFATLAYHPEGDILERLAEHAVTIIPTFRPQATSNTLWAFAKLAFTPCEALLRAAAQQMVCDLGKSVPQVCPVKEWIPLPPPGHSYQACLTIQVAGDVLVCFGDMRLEHIANASMKTPIMS